MLLHPQGPLFLRQFFVTPSSLLANHTCLSLRLVRFEEEVCLAYSARHITINWWSQYVVIGNKG